MKRFHAYGPQWADMAEGSGYETVVHRQPLLRWVYCCHFSGSLHVQHGEGHPTICTDGLQGHARHRQKRMAVLLTSDQKVLGAGAAEDFVKEGHGNGLAWVFHGMARVSTSGLLNWDNQ